MLIHSEIEKTVRANKEQNKKIKINFFTELFR